MTQVQPIRMVEIPFEEPKKKVEESESVPVRVDPLRLEKKEKNELRSWDTESSAPGGVPSKFQCIDKVTGSKVTASNRGGSHINTATSRY